MIRRFTSLLAPLTLSAILALMGCNSSSTPPASSGTPAADHKGHDPAAEGHAEEGPHHGHLIELGEEEYHAELAHDEASKTVTVYLLDKEAKTPVAIADAEIVLNLVVDGQPLQAKLVAAPQDGDPVGQASRLPTKRCSKRLKLPRQRAASTCRSPARRIPARSSTKSTASTSTDRRR
jgi:hypothetical protein